MSFSSDAEESDGGERGLLRGNAVLDFTDESGVRETSLRAELAAALRLNKILKVFAAVLVFASGALVVPQFRGRAMPLCGSRTIAVQSCTGEMHENGKITPYAFVPCNRAASAELASGAGGIAGPIARIDVFKGTDPSSNEEVRWPWGSGQCGGLGGPPWRESNGADLEAVLRQEVKRLRHFGVNGGVSIDIGAHMGDTSASMALVSDRVIAFEPNPLVFPYTEALANINPHLNIDPWNFGVSDAKGELEFSYGGMCNGGVKGFGSGGSDQTTVTLHVVALKSFLAAHYPPKLLSEIGFIKMDTEGYDAVIVKALAPFITEICDSRAAGCPIIQVEWFNPFREDPNDAGSKRLFDSFKSLPGTWDVTCSAVCNSPGPHCDAARQDPAKITGPADPNRGLCEDLVLTHVRPD